MKKLVILLLCGAFALSCTDKAYDLSQIETGDVAIGNDDSEFRMPLPSPSRAIPASARAAS